jgi:probable F420-dependent oxidoreductase
MQRPRIGLHLPNAGPLADAQLLLAAAAAAEDLGYDSLWLFDHLVTPVDLASTYPYTPDGSYLFTVDQPFFDALGTLAVLAGATQRVTLGTAVMVPTLRPALPLARTLATFDALCGGRLAMGFGAGWMREEFEIVGVDPRTRGRRLEEQVAALRTAWGSDVSSFDGEFFHWPESGLLPRPHQGRAIPILIGGHSDRAIDRAARIGDGWAVTVPGRAGADLDVLAESLARLEDARHRVGTSERRFDVHLFAPVSVRPWTKDTPRPLLVGEPEQVRDDVGRLADIGVGTLDLFVGARDGDGYLAGVVEVAEAVLTT